MFIKALETDEEAKEKAYVHWKSWHEAYPGIVKKEYLDKLTLEKCEDISFRFKDDNNYLAIEDGKVVGFVNYSDRSDEHPGLGEINAIYVLSEFYGKGVGAKLLETALEKLKGCSQIVLTVLKDNPRAINFYKKFGFMEKLGSESFLENLGASVIVMVRVGGNYIKLVNDDFLGRVEKFRYACRGILVKDGKVLLGYAASDDMYMIPGGGVEGDESYEECCVREMLEETGMKVDAKECFYTVEELFDVWRHFSYFFACEFIEDTGKLNLTEYEAKAGCTCEWVPIEDALKIFGKYEDFHKINIAIYGLYKREYLALTEYSKVYCK